MKSGVNPAILPDISCQSVCISGLQLCKLSVLQNITHNRMFRCKLIQHVRRRGITGLRLFTSRQLHFLKENGPQLFWRVNVKILACLSTNLLLQLTNSHLKLLSVDSKRLSLHLNPFFFHGIQSKHQRHLNLLKNPLHTCLSQSLFQRSFHSQRHISHKTTQPLHLFRLLRQGILVPFLANHLLASWENLPQIFLADILVVVGRLQRIEKISRHFRTKSLRPGFHVHIFQKNFHMKSCNLCLLCHLRQLVRQVLSAHKA